MSQALAWQLPLNTRRGGATYLDGIDVYYDFAWHEVFGHNRSQFKNGQCLARLARENCPEGKTAALLLTVQDVREGPRTTNSHFFLVVRIRAYLARATGDPALSYYAAQLRSEMARLEQLDELATDPAVVEAVLEAERAAAATDPERRAHLREALGLTEAPDLATLVQALRAFAEVDLDPEAVRLVAGLFGADTDRERRLQLVRAITDDPSGRYITGEVLAERTSERIADARNAMADYQALLDDPETGETQMQAFIETNLWLLGLDYARMAARQRTISGTVDFALERFDGFQDVLELKDPRDPIIRVRHEANGDNPAAPPPSAYSLSPDLAQALGQVHSYRDRLTAYAQANTELVGLTASRDPRLIIVIGRADRLDEHARRVLGELNKSLHWVEVVPYDVLARRAEAVLDNVQQYLLASVESIQGGV